MTAQHVRYWHIADIELKTTSGKIFAGSYAIFSGLVIVIAATFVLAPILNRILHRFQVAVIEIRLI